MTSKSLLIAIAAIAVSASGAQAFNGIVLKEAGLSESQIAAFEVAYELKREGDQDGARDILVEAGIDETVMERIKRAMHEHRDSHHEAISAAVAADDFAAFTAAVAGSPLSDIIITEADFAQFKEVHTLRNAGENQQARALAAELGLPMKGHGATYHDRPSMRHWHEQLTPVQREALQVAKSANDREAVRAIMAEAGLVEQANPQPMRGGYRPYALDN